MGNPVLFTAKPIESFPYPWEEETIIDDGQKPVLGAFDPWKYPKELMDEAFELAHTYITVWPQLTVSFNKTSFEVGVSLDFEAVNMPHSAYHEDWLELGMSLPGSFFSIDPTLYMKTPAMSVLDILPPSADMPMKALATKTYKVNRIRVFIPGRSVSHLIIRYLIDHVESWGDKDCPSLIG